MNTKQSIHSKVMILAWKLYRSNKLNAQFSNEKVTFGSCLSTAWQSYTKVSYKSIVVNILQRLTFVDVKREYINADGEHIQPKGTKDYWHIQNNKAIRKTEDQDVRDLLDSGSIPLWDMINERKRLRPKSAIEPRKERVKRPRIQYKY